MIDFEHVTKVYETQNDENVALEDINIHIDEGEFVFILGHSGAGKSTFLKLIQMEEKPTEGKIYINDQDLTTIKRRKVPYLRRRMGVVFQDFRLIPTMSVYENVAFGLLADYKDAPVPTLPEDEKIATALEEAIHLLNRKYGNHFCLFLRGRSKSPSEKIYMGWERKRGALIELNRFLLGREDRFEKVILPKGFRNNTAYILTLDADTDLRIGALRRLYATLKHPYNRPKVKNGVVTALKPGKCKITAQAGDGKAVCTVIWATK